MEFVGVFLGAFLGFALGIVADEVVHQRRQTALKVLARDVIASEVIYNLEVLEAIALCARKTTDQNFVALHTPIGTIRVETLQQFVGNEALTSLSNQERLFLVEVVGNLKRADDQFASWRRDVDSTTGLTPVVIEETGLPTTYRELSTTRLVRVIGIIQAHLIDLLVQVCNNLKIGELTDSRTKAAQAKLVDTRDGWPNKPNYCRAGRSSEVKQAGEEKLAELAKTYRHLVVWEHDWTECPLPVIELRESAQESEFEFRPTPPPAAI